jgi:endonuclease YncB( thermonuclease family)
MSLAAWGGLPGCGPEPQRQYVDEGPRRPNTVDGCGPSLDQPSTIVGVIDGGGRRERVRLKGIDAPELDPVEPYGITARDFARQTLGDEVCLEFDSACPVPPQEHCRDVFGRLLAYVRRLDGADHGAELLSRGLARVYNFRGEGFDRQAAYNALEVQARQSERGIWSQ